jgi:TolB-like protein/tetratricopeptide (TPR) repeat protein
MALGPGTRLGPYEILSPIGAGGMGEVYRARDSKLKRDVAIKVLPQSLTVHPDALARFEQEALAVAALSHPNVLGIHDFGMQEGTAYAVMELLEGETLRQKLAAGRIPPKQATDYALQIARGLSAAHEKGIVHRDLKPENIMVTKDELVKILDFGLAKRVGRVCEQDVPTASTQELYTEPGTLMGTVGYMSPEQVRGLPIDHRSDIFSLGSILYELLSGKRAFGRPTVGDTIAAIVRDEPEDLSGIPAALDRTVRHCLEKDRNNRFQTAKDLAFALAEASGPTAVTSGAQQAVGPSGGKRQVLIAAVVVAVLAVAGVFLLRHEATREAKGARRVAVLPFENLGAPEDDYFADGIADAVRGKLTTLRGVQVIARGSSTPYKKTTKTPNEIARELDVDYLLTATVRWQKDAGTASRVEVSPELIAISRTGSPTSKWQQPFNAALTDVFDVQSDIASKVAQALGVALGVGEEKRLSEKPTENLAAYDSFLKGEEASKAMGATDPPSVRKALGFYEQAVALDPGFALAWTRVSAASSTLYVNSVPTREQAERARQAAEKATALAPNRPEGYLALGIYEQMIAADFRRSLTQLAKGQRLAPTNAEILSWTARAEASLGRWDAAVRHLKQAAVLDPRSIVAHRRLSWALLYLRRYPDAREVLDRGLALAPTNLSLIQQKAMVFLGQGDLAGARAFLKGTPREVEPTALVVFLAQYWDLVWLLDEGQQELLLRLTPGAFDEDKATWAICLAQAYALRGDAANLRTYAEEARKANEELLRAGPPDPQRYVSLGLALAYLGRKDEAIREGQRGAALVPVAKDAYLGAYMQHQLVRIAMLVGEPERALDRLEPLMKIPYYVSPGWLRIDPNFDPLRKDPRFRKLVAETK